MYFLKYFIVLYLLLINYSLYAEDKDYPYDKETGTVLDLMPGQQRWVTAPHLDWTGKEKNITFLPI